MADNQIAYGFVGHERLFSELVDDAGVPLVMEAITRSVAEYNRQVTALLAGMVEITTDFKRSFKLPSGGTLQPLDEWGNPVPVQPAGQYGIAFPIQGGGTAFGDNRVSRALMTVEKANEQTLMVQRQDADWLRRHILAALFTDASWTYADAEHDDLTIQPLANGDSVTYMRRNGVMATDTHYLAQADSIDNTHNPFDSIYTELAEHPENNGPFVIYIPTNLVSAVTALADFLEITDPDIALGANSDQVVGRLDVGFGHELLGKISKLWVIEWQDLPDNYMIAHARGAAPVLAMRQYPAAALQGLFQENHSPDGNLNVLRFIRYAGFGANNRVGALVYRVGNASYADPSGYTAPLPV